MDLTREAWTPFLLLVVLTLVDVSFLGYIWPMSIRPNLALFFALYYTVINDRSILFLAFAGFLLDIYSPLFPGVNLILFTLIGLILVKSKKSFLPEKNIAFYIIIAIVSFLYPILLKVL